MESFRSRQQRGAVQGVAAAMLKAVAGDLMTLLDDAPHQRGMTFGDPAQGEESGLGTRCGEHFEDAVGVALDPAGVIVPVLAVDQAEKSLDLEIILDIHRHHGAMRIRGRDQARGPAGNPVAVFPALYHRGYRFNGSNRIVAGRPPGGA